MLTQEKVAYNSLSIEVMLPRVINCPSVAAIIHWEKLCEIRGVCSSGVTQADPNTGSWQEN